MNDNRFDDIIRSKLKNYKSNSQADWESFKRSKILSDASYDASFDSKIKDRLRNYEVDRSPIAWQDLYSTFRRQVYIRNQIIAIKSGELLILFLSLFTFFNFYDIDIFNKGNKIQIAEIEIHHEVIQSQNDVIQDRKELLNLAELNKINWIERSQKKVVRINSSDNLLASPIIMNQGTEEEVDHKVRNVRKTLVNTLIDEREGQIPAKNTSDSKVNVNTNLEFLEAKEILLSEFQRPKIEIETGKSELSESSLTNQGSENWLSFGTLINNNTINSPRDVVYNLDEQVLYTPGFSLLTNYSKTIGAWEHVIGLSYSNISYAPYPVRESYQTEKGINVVSLNNISYHMISIPLFSRFHFIQTDDWSMFGGFGAQCGLVLHEFYDISDELDVPLPAPQNSESQTEYRSRLSQKEFTRAVFNGGKFSDNVFVHARFSLGVQRHLGENMHLFLSAEYLRHLISPLGPNKDKINILSFGAGMKFRI